MAEGRQIRVVGEGSREAAPDRWILMAAINAMADSAAEALTIVTQKVSAATKAITGLAIPPESLQTKNLLLHDWFDQAQQRVTARVASYELEITVAELGALGSVLSALTVEIGENFQLRGLRATVSDPEPLYDAQQEAMSNAAAKAQNLAESAGIALGPILSIEEQRTVAGLVQTMPMSRAASGQAILPPVPIEPGTFSVRAVVSVVYEIT